MNYKQNLHTHSTFCDGKNTPEETVLTAIEKGFGSIGFSIHSDPPPSSNTFHLRSADYKAELARLKQAYKGVIDIYTGIEYDIYSGSALEGYDYAIGSVHYLKVGDEFKKMDLKLLEDVHELINTCYNGDPLRFAKAYYEAVASIPEYGSFDIIGHFDLLTKHNEKGGFLDVTSREYLNYAFEAISALKGKIPLFEVNTGALARGYRTTPYPQPEILAELKRNGFGAVISSDCHRKECLDVYFEESLQLLANAGFTSRFILTSDGFREIPLFG